jgi:hypothetical protein
MRISDLTDPILQLICDYLSDRDLIAIIQVTSPPKPPKFARQLKTPHL